MIKYKLRNQYNTTPPNCDHQILLHPSGNKQECIELAIFNEHRFAFYYWIKWNSTRTYQEVPDLVTFDWHQDLAYPCDGQKEELRKLDHKNLEEVAFFTWSRLCSLNDDHIISAAYLNQLKDIWVVCKQSRHSDWSDEEIIDYQGNVHKIRKFPNPEELHRNIIKSKTEHIYFDIDLDYFTIKNSTSNDKRIFTYVPNNEISEHFSWDSELMKWILKRMDGFTIALEPEHTGGITKSLKYLKLLNQIFFKGRIFHKCKWRHL